MDWHETGSQRGLPTFEGNAPLLKTHVASTPKI